MLDAPEKVAKQVRHAIEQGCSNEEVAALLAPDYRHSYSGSASAERFINYCHIPDSIERCGVQTGYDIQSGPYRCGNVATHRYEIVGEPNCYVILCDRCNKRIQRDVLRGERNRARLADESLTCSEL